MGVLTLSTQETVVFYGWNGNYMVSENLRSAVERKGNNFRDFKDFDLNANFDLNCLMCAVYARQRDPAQHTRRQAHGARIVDVKLPGKGDSNFNDARPVH